MPLYEYVCRSCDRRFERLQAMGAPSTDVSCPQCGDEEVERQLSTFSGSSSGSSSAGFSSPGGCGSRGFT